MVCLLLDLWLFVFAVVCFDVVWRLLYWLLVCFVVCLVLLVLVFIVLLWCSLFVERSGLVM